MLLQVTEYSHGTTDLLGIQIDAAINGGNSGGPVFDERGRCVGIAFQALSGSDVENVGYVIPTPVVNHFLMDYQKNGHFTGFPALGIQWQRMESEALRKAYKMGSKAKGNGGHTRLWCSSLQSLVLLPVIELSLQHNDIIWLVMLTNTCLNWPSYCPA